MSEMDDLREDVEDLQDRVSHLEELLQALGRKKPSAFEAHHKRFVQRLREQET